LSCILSTQLHQLPSSALLPAHTFYIIYVYFTTKPWNLDKISAIKRSWLLDENQTTRIPTWLKYNLEYELPDHHRRSRFATVWLQRIQFLQIYTIFTWAVVMAVAPGWSIKYCLSSLKSTK
jgi:hypothetical protein